MDKEVVVVERDVLSNLVVTELLSKGEPLQIELERAAVGEIAKTVDYFLEEDEIVLAIRKETDNLPGASVMLTRMDKGYELILLEVFGRDFKAPVGNPSRILFFKVKK